jgi:hypothetical protein
VARGDFVQGDVESATILVLCVSDILCEPVSRSHTLSSAPEATLCAKTTRCANLMQQILTEGAALSHIRKIFCLIATILCHVIVS